MKSFIKELMKKGAQKISGQGKTTGTEVIKNVKIAPNIDTKKAIEQNVVSAVDSAFKKADVPPSLRNQQKKSQSTTTEHTRRQEMNQLFYSFDGCPSLVGSLTTQKIALVELF